MELGGNITAWVTLRAISRNDREFEKALQEWKQKREEVWQRKLKRQGATK